MPLLPKEGPSSAEASSFMTSRRSQSAVKPLPKACSRRSPGAKRVHGAAPRRFKKYCRYLSLTLVANSEVKKRCGTGTVVIFVIFVIYFGGYILGGVALGAPGEVGLVFGSEFRKKIAKIATITTTAAAQALLMS